MATHSHPSQLGARIASMPRRISRIASAHPVHAIVLISLLVSSVYVSLLENSILHVSKGHPGAFSLQSAKQLHAGPETAWKWNTATLEHVESAVEHRVIVTLDFKQGNIDNIPSIPPPEHLSVEQLPSLNAGSTRAGHSLSFSVAKNDVSEFVAHVHSLSLKNSPVSEYDTNEPSGSWIVDAPRKTHRSLGRLVQDKWAELVYLFKHAGPLNIAMMAIAYTAMYLTFGSLFVSMYRMGSRFWLAAGVLLSSTFAFILALFTTTQLGTPVDLVALSEGLPFLVVAIGFENSIKLTQSVLSQARKSSGSQRSVPGTDTKPALSLIQTAIQTSVTQEGPGIVRQHMIEIAVLLAGALFSVDSALRQFCFLSAWILFFDCLMTFSFFVAVLCIKLEIVQIKSGGKEYHLTSSTTHDLNGLGLGRTHIRRFKLGMISAFILVNVLNISMIPFRGAVSLPSLPLLSHARSQGHVNSPLVASYSLEAILAKAILDGQKTAVTLFPSIQFVLDTPGATESPSSYGVSSLLRSLEDPVLFKGIIVALVISVALNGRLFAAARTGVKGSTARFQQQQRVPAIYITAPSSAQSECHSSVTDLARSADECRTMLKEGRSLELTDEEIIDHSLAGNLPLHALEKTLKDFTRAVKIRRGVVSRTTATSDLTNSLETSELPFEQYDWSRVFGVCCENVVGYMPIPVGLAGPLQIDGRSYFLPMATTEGVLVAGVMRGSKAINAGGGVQTVLTADGMTRGPCVSFESLDRTAEAKQWLDSSAGQEVMKSAFNSTTRYGRLQSMKTAMAGTNLYIRFKATTGDAMGMNMISKGVEHALDTMRKKGFQDMDIISLSANYCSDKKPAAINWIDGRGKSVVAQATIPAEVVKSVLKTDVDSMVALNVDKNLIGSAMAGSIGGFNAHAANIVAAMYIATGQDPAQVVESANCITVMKNIRGALQISVSMPSMEVGTIGGGTTLGPQRAMLDILGVRGANCENPGENARRLARIIAAATLAAELSLCAALAAGHLVKAHMEHNRAQPNQV